MADKVRVAIDGLGNWDTTGSPMAIACIST